ncbi:MAG: secondary thiamine-phosphate synthase enzyme YjbQ [Thermoleophilia bacterium]
MAIIELRIETQGRDQLLDITDAVRGAVAENGLRDGCCRVFVPHTTAAVTINEGADPAVVRDIIMGLDQAIPHENSYRHAEGNSAAHIKTTLVGASETILVEGGELVLGTWQSIYFCEFDGPRTRKVLVKCSEG